MTVSPGYGARSERDRRQRAHEIRAGLPGQARQARLMTASMLYGPLCSLDALHRRIARALPLQLGHVRHVRMSPIEQSDALIPDDVLLRYDEAVQLSVFARFLIATPAYWFGAHGDPWLVAEVAGTDRWAVIARWGEDPTSAWMNDNTRYEEGR
jgi:hypothetical protein